MPDSVRISGNIVDIIGRRIYYGTLYVNNGKIVEIVEEAGSSEYFLLPGFIDAHVHIESSMLIPSEFARLAVVHGTVATVSDPHEIANVLGIPGIDYMIGNGKKVPFHFYFGAPSCVPATPFETAGAVFGLRETEDLLSRPDIHYLSEMMNFPGVLSSDSEVMGKIALAGKYRKPVDGHAPGLKGKEAQTYAEAGISTDHECFSLEEAVDKVKSGMKILIREGSAARNFDTLIPLISDYPEQVMLCSDDKHPDNLVIGHINLLARRAVEAGYDWMSVLRACSLVPVKHYGLDVGLLQPGDNADFIKVDSLTRLQVKETWINGVKVAENGKSLISSVYENTPNNFHARMLLARDLEIPALSSKIKVQKAYDGQLLTDSWVTDAHIQDGMVISDPERDILKMLVLNRYRPEPPALGFVNNFGLNRGAIASSVAHDSHNIIAVGVNDRDIIQAVNLLVEAGGGISLSDGNKTALLPLPVAGLMSGNDGYTVADQYKKMDEMAKSLGCALNAPYMTLSFMALLVIPALKISDKGMFDGARFAFTDIFIH